MVNVEWEIVMGTVNGLLWMNLDKLSTPEE